jgi:hypothetical protein
MIKKIKEDVQTILEDVEMEISETGDCQTKERMQATLETVNRLIQKVEKLELTESVYLTGGEAQEIYYALESKIAPTGIASDDKKWKADIEAIMDKIGVDGVNLVNE